MRQNTARKSRYTYPLCPPPAPPPARREKCGPRAATRVLVELQYTHPGSISTSSVSDGSSRVHPSAAVPSRGTRCFRSSGRRCVTDIRMIVENDDARGAAADWKTHCAIENAIFPKVDSYHDQQVQSRRCHKMSWKLLGASAAVACVAV
jgi:hypothetical protein